MLELKFRHSKDTYHIPIHGKFNILVGDSGTGKTLLYTHLRDFEVNALGHQSGPYTLVTFDHYMDNRSELKESKCVVYVDELIRPHKKLQEQLVEIKNDPVLFVLAMRDLPHYLEFGIHDIFVLEKKGNLHKWSWAYPNLTQLRRYDIPDGSVVLCEDGESGFFCLNKLYGDRVVSSNGKDSLHEMIDEIDKDVFLYCDLCGIGAELPNVINAIGRHRCKVIVDGCLSFERDALDNKDLQRVNVPRLYSEAYAFETTEETFYEEALSEAMLARFGFKYNKSSRKCMSFLLGDTSWIPRVVHSQIESRNGTINKLNLEG